MMVYRLDLSYDGQGFHGYARQPGLRTIQGELETALGQVLGRMAGVEQPVLTEVAGRTDAGVHARHQVASFQLDRPADLDLEGLVRSLNQSLPPDIVVFGAQPAPEGFSARFSALSRTYRYRILNQPFPDPLRRGFVWHVKKPLDVAAMNQAVGLLVGEHDFASFCRRAQGRTTERTVLAAEWSTGPPEMVCLEITAQAFCHQMVRSIAAFSVEVGLGKRSPDSMSAVLQARDRAAAAGVAPPHGLVLCEVAF